MTEQVLVVASSTPGIGGKDSGNQGWLMAHAMRRYLGWQAKCLVTEQSYLRYPYDWVLNDNVSPDTVLDYAGDTTFFVFMDAITPELCKYLTPTNHCILGVGSGLRANADHTLMDQIKTGLPVVVVPQDETTINRVIGIPFDYLIVDIEQIGFLTKNTKKNDEFTVCHSHTHPGLKGHDIIERLKNDFPDVVFDEIKHMSWSEAIKRKARAHVVLDDFFLPTYGLNVLEAGILRQHVITNIGPWCYMIYPDFPFKTVNPAVTGRDMYESARSQLVYIRDNVASGAFGTPYPLLAAERRGCSEWVRVHHGAEYQAKRWEMFVKWLKNR